jgi:hypothetical protein
MLQRKILIASDAFGRTITEQPPKACSGQIHLKWVGRA